ncbi:hypothetical protein ACIO3O_15670 [Streptomyces sp. NPDC087440]|uniref:hypothetical protein n=1 Tax=Streptomyces sp. NPDC087440 TaxID=3365790 RepID=UPI00380C4FE5
MHTPSRPRPTGAALAALVAAGLALGVPGTVAMADTPTPAEAAAPLADAPAETAAPLAEPAENTAPAEAPAPVAGNATPADTPADPLAEDPPSLPLPEQGAPSDTDPPPAGDLTVTPEFVAPGTEVSVHTDACGPHMKGTGNASSLGIGDFALAGGDSQQALAGEFTVPATTTPGTYGISVSCADGKKSAMGDLVVRAATGASTSPSAVPTTPTGHVRTGVGGGTTAPNTPQIAAGVAFLAASAVGGTWLLRRRASGSR